jgi:replicative DNA helicase
MGDVKNPDLADRKKGGTLPADPATETRRLRAPRLRLVGDDESAPTPAAVDIDAERAICSSLLWSATYTPGAARASTITDLVEAKSFWDGQHQAIFAAVLALEEAGRVAEPIAVRSEATRQRRSVDLEYMQQLVEVAVAPNEVKLRQWAELVRDAWLRRHAILAAKKLIDDAESGHRTIVECLEPHGRTIEKIRERTAASAELVSIKTIAKKAFNGLNAEQANFLPTGFRDLDAMIGGLFPEEVSYFAARTSVGKSACAMTIAEHIAKTQPHVGVIYASLEMPAEQFVQRRAAAHARVKLEKIRQKTMNIDEQAKVAIEIAKLGELAIEFIDSTSQTCSSLTDLVKQYQVKLHAEKKRVGLLVVDHIGKIKPSARTDRAQRREQIAEISNWMCTAARALQCHVMALVQISREAEKQGKDTTPALHHLKDGSSLEEDANNVFILHRRRNKNNGFIDEPAKLMVAKARNGALGHVQLHVDPRFVLFGDSRPDDTPPSRQYVPGYFGDDEDVPEGA